MKYISIIPFLMLLGMTALQAVEPYSQDNPMTLAAVVREPSPPKDHTVGGG